MTQAPQTVRNVGFFDYDKQLQLQNFKEFVQNTKTLQDTDEINTDTSPFFYVLDVEAP